MDISQQQQQQHVQHQQQQKTQQQRQRQRQQDTYQSGHVQIRGMYRRLWRPRYLEIRDDGTVRYYEVFKTGNSTGSSSSTTGRSTTITATKLKKLRDRELLREQQQQQQQQRQQQLLNNSGLSENGDGNTNIPDDDLTLESIWDEMSILSQQQQQLKLPISPNTHRLKAIMTIHDARLLNPKLSRDAHISIPSGYYGFLFHGSSFYVSSADHKSSTGTGGSSSTSGSSRDFLCMVSSREEAKKWVHALQWAAGLMLLPPVSSFGGRCNTSGMFSNNRILSTTSSSSMIEEGDEGQQPEVVDEQQRREDGVCNSIITTSNIKSNGSPRNNVGGGTVLITKIRKFHISSLSHETPTPTVNYQIKLLKLPTTTKSTNSTNNMEEWTYNYPYIKILQFLFQIQKEFLQEDDVYFYLLRTLQSDLFTSTNKWVLIPPHIQMKRKLERMDEVIRFLSSHTKICNSNLLKQFLGLTSNSTRDGVVIHKKQIKFDEVHMKKDEFVKCWLWKDDTDRITMQEWMLFYMVSYPWRVRLFFISTVIILPLWYTSTDYLSSEITLPAYIWIGSMSILFYVGYIIGIYHPNFISSICAQCVEYVIHFRQKNIVKKKSHLDQSVVKRQQKRVKNERRKKADTPKTATTIQKEKRRTTSTTDSITITNKQYDKSEQPSDSAILQPQENDSNEQPLDDGETSTPSILSSPLPEYPGPCNGTSCWSQSPYHLFKVRGKDYLTDRIKHPSGPALFKCRGVDVFMTYDPLYHISRHPDVLGGKLWDEHTLVINFLLPFGNFVAYFTMNDDVLDEEKHGNCVSVWRKFVKGDQQYRDARLKMLPLVIDGPWIVRKAVGPGNAPAVLSKVLPLQYYLTPNNFNSPNTSSIFEIDVIISASRMANAILNVVKGHTKNLTIAFAFIIEGINEEELPENVICAFTMHELDLAKCPQLPKWNDGNTSSGSLEDSGIFSNSTSGDDDEIEEEEENEKSN